ncbi:MAG: peptidoglycan DD-metalloendopeptidase family protein [Ilumatobacteraceae bacterium]
MAATLAPTAAGAQTSEERAEQAAREIQAARDRANAAADAFFRAQSDLELLQDDAERLAREAEQLQEVVDELQRDVEGIALARFVSSGSSGIPLLTGVQAPQDQVQAQVFYDVMTNSGSNTLDRFDAAQQDLADKQDELAQSRREVQDAQGAFSRLQDEANAEVERLREIEEERLQDEAVVRALAAQQAAERARIIEEQRKLAEAASRAQPNPGIDTSVTTTPTTSTTTTTTLVPVTTPDGSIVVPDAPAETPAATTTPPATIATTLPPASTVPTNAGASGSTSGGRTGTGGAGSSPTPVSPQLGGGYVEGILCPMLGSAYGDTWGAPRSGGRRHEGVDMLAPNGTPIYAVVNGTIRYWQNRLGGNAVSLYGDNGTRYYYGHLSRFEGEGGRRVRQGEVIGYNGDTGNATGVPHLHFEIHPNGGLAVNPTPSVRAAGC